MEIPDGWTAYDGEGQPVSDDVMVAVILRHENGIYEDGSPAGDLIWEHIPQCDSADIIAYKIVGPSNA